VTLIPIDEGAIHIKGANIAVRGGSTTNAVIKVAADDLVYAFTGTSNTSHIRSVEFTPYTWSLPTGAGLIVVAAQRADEQNITDGVDISGAYFPRWTLLRGSA
jgi:hypothetical protein